MGIFWHPTAAVRLRLNRLRDGEEPQSCMPQPTNAKFELRVTDAANRYPRFDERLTMIPKRSLGHHCEGYCPDQPPRPTIAVQSQVAGQPVATDELEIDPETGMKTVVEEEASVEHIVLP